MISADTLTFLAPTHPHIFFYLNPSPITLRVQNYVSQNALFFRPIFLLEDLNLK